VAGVLATAGSVPLLFLSVALPSMLMTATVSLTDAGDSLPVFPGALLVGGVLATLLTAEAVRHRVPRSRLATSGVVHGPASAADPTTIQVWGTKS
jgi:hypothetical protein